MTATLARRALAVVLLALAVGLPSCQSSPRRAACPSGQQQEALGGTWKCSSGPDPVTDACPPGKTLTFAPGKPLECK